MDVGVVPGSTEALHMGSVEPQRQALPRALALQPEVSGRLEVGAWSERAAWVLELDDSSTEILPDAHRPQQHTAAALPGEVSGQDVMVAVLGGPSSGVIESRGGCAGIATADLAVRELPALGPALLEAEPGRAGHGAQPQSPRWNNSFGVELLVPPSPQNHQRLVECLG